MPDPNDETQPELPQAPSEPKVEIPKASARSSAKKSAKPSAKRSHKKAASPKVKASKKSGAKAKKPSKPSASKKSAKKAKATSARAGGAGKAKAKRKASPKASPTTVVRKKSIRSSVGTSTTKGRQGIRKDGKPRQSQKAPTSRADAVYGAKIAVERRLKLMSQTAFAEKIGIQQGYLSTIERGTNPAPEALRAKIKKVLGV